MDGGDQSISGLLCLESESCLEEEEEVGVNEDALDIDITISNKSCGCCDLFKGDEYVEMLVERETGLGYGKDQSLVLDDNWVKCARLEAISWILKTRTMFGFGFQTAYLSLTYFDRFLSRRSIDSDKSWAFRLLSMACLSLAAKMEEIKVPALTDFQSEDYNFGSEVIQKMELLLLSTLEWRMISITPFAFLPYFITKLFEDPPSQDVVSRISGFILAPIREVNLTSHRPSSMAAAAAAAAAALDQSLTRNALECKLNPITSSGFLDIEDVFECYDLMRKWGMEKNLKASIRVKSPDLSPVRLKSMKISENSSDRVKRRRLEFSSPDQDHGLSDGKRTQ